VFRLTSPAFEDGQEMAQKYGITGRMIVVVGKEDDLD
jgi:hypothetical protein